MTPVFETGGLVSESLIQPARLGAASNGKAMTISSNEIPAGCLLGIAPGAPSATVTMLATALPPATDSRYEGWPSTTRTARAGVLELRIAALANVAADAADEPSNAGGA